MTACEPTALYRLYDATGYFGHRFVAVRLADVLEIEWAGWYAAPGPFGMEFDMEPLGKRQTEWQGLVHVPWGRE